MLVVIAFKTVLMGVLMLYTTPIRTTWFSRFWQFISGNAILRQFFSCSKGVSMKRRTFLKVSAMSTAVAACGSFASNLVKKKRSRPNILLLFSDQHHAGVMGCAGHPLVKTRHLDRLASEGVLFSRAYCQDGICVPSRTSMFTGLYPRTTGVIYNSDAPPHPERLHPLHSVLRANGYITGCFGKRHFPRGLNERDWDASCTTINPKLDPSDENYRDWINWRGQYDSHNRDFIARSLADGSHFSYCR